MRVAGSGKYAARTSARSDGEMVPGPPRGTSVARSSAGTPSTCRRGVNESVSRAIRQTAAAIPPPEEKPPTETGAEAAVRAATSWDCSWARG